MGRQHWASGFGDDEPGSMPALDDAFVRGAATRELSARERELEAERARAAHRAGRLRAERTVGLEEQHRGTPHRRGRRPAVRWAVAICVIAGGAVVVSRLNRRRVATGSVTAVTAALPTATATTTIQAAGAIGDPTSTTISLSTRNFAAGDCATWDQRAGRSPEGRPTFTVPCGTPHLVEIVDRQEITGLSVDWPGQPQLDQYVNARCPAAAQTYLGYPVDPFGRFVVSAISPTKRGWLAGDRTMWCDLQLGGPEDAPLPSFTGAVKGADQTLLEPVGACLPPADNGSGGAPVSCNQPHILEITGNVNLAGRATRLPASDAQWQAVVGMDCSRFALAYLGGSYPPGVQRGWLSIAPSSWSAGSRIVQCTVGKLANETWVPVTNRLGRSPAP